MESKQILSNDIFIKEQPSNDKSYHCAICGGEFAQLEHPLHLEHNEEKRAVHFKCWNEIK